MTDVYLQAEEWYRNNSQTLATHFVNVEFRSNAGNVLRGGVHFALTGNTLLATITFWNKGDVEVQILKKDSTNPIILHDRLLGADESIPALLDGYLREILTLV